jgi:hypothetical protein
VVLKYAKDAPNLDTNNQSPEYLWEEEFKQKLTKAIASLSEAQRSIFIESNRWKNTEKSLNYSIFLKNRWKKNVWGITTIESPNRKYIINHLAIGNLKVSCLINIEIENGKRKEILKWFNDELSSQKSRI